MKKSKMKLATVASLALLVLAGVTTIPGVNSSSFLPYPIYRDYSYLNGEYTALKGLELKAYSIKFTGTEKAKLFGTDLEFQNFEITAPVIVQTICVLDRGIYEPATARYRLSVATDINDTARQEFMRQIKSYWKAKDPEELKSYQYLPQEKFLWLDKKQYVLYLQPDNEWDGATYHFYAAGKVIRLTLQGFQKGGGTGGISYFVSHNLIFKFPTNKINAGDNIDISPTRFWELDRNGFFKNAPTSKRK